MRRRRWMAAAMLLFLLSGCADPSPPSPPVGSNELPTPVLTQAAAPPSDPSEALATSAPSETARDPEGESTGPAQTEPASTAPSEREAAGTEPAPTEAAPTQPAPAEARPRVLSLGLYDGPYPEDGSGEAVESIAVILAENDSDTQLQFAELHYRIDSREAVFRISELPPGEKVMAVEINRLVAMPISVWEPDPEKDLFVYTAAEPSAGLELQREADGRLRVTNGSSQAASFDLIYKQRGDDGVFVGGIAYHVAVPSLKPGESQTVDAPHFTENSMVVRITAKAR